MTDSPKDSQSPTTTTAVTYIDGVPHWDVGADQVIYRMMLELSKDGTLIEEPLRVVMNQHTDMQAKKGSAYEHKQTLRAATTNMKMHGDEMDIPDMNEKPLHQFVDKHFAGFLKVDIPEEQHKPWLNANSFMKTRIFRECIQGIALQEDVAEEVPTEITQLRLVVGEELIPLVQTLYSDKEDRAEEIKIRHTWGPAAEGDYHKHRRSSSQSFNSRKRTFTSRENYDVLEQLYDDKIHSVEGMCINGKPCTKENKDEWVHLIPLEHKLLVLELIFRKARIKNVS